MHRARRASTHEVALFRKTVRNFYAKHGRDFPWRKTRSPYRILVSEVMLQQTQTHRVAPKYAEFIKRFPSFATLARASFRDVLSVWRGLGYNRRALALQTSARILIERYKGRLPRDGAELDKLPGVGRATAAAVAAFAFNLPSVFIETNIRAAFIHFFFPRARNVHDREVAPLVEATLDKKNPRDWYYALMDYGAALKRETPNPSRRSAHYARQSPFAGSDREIRGRALKLLTEAGRCSLRRASRALSRPQDRVETILARLAREGLVKRSGALYEIAEPNV